MRQLSIECKSGPVEDLDDKVNEAAARIEKEGGTIVAIHPIVISNSTGVGCTTIVFQPRKEPKPALDEPLQA